MDEKLAEDVAFASAAYLLDYLPPLFLLSQGEQFDHLATVIDAAITAYCDGVRGWFIPDPSVN